MSAERQIIAIVGRQLAGKDTVAKYLEERHGFHHVSTGDLIREYIVEHKLGVPDRRMCHITANRLRAQQPDFWVREALSKKYDKLVISGIRAFAEAETPKQEGALILHVDAPIKLRYKRAGGRNRVGDSVTLEEFQKQQDIEEANDEPTAQNIKPLIAMADATVTNDGDVVQLEHQIDEFVHNSFGG